jgi:uncharacterized protein YbgA (DUF1722 family)
MAQQDEETFKKAYASEYIQALAIRSSRKKHSDALLHVFGFLKKQLGKDERANLLQTIETYRSGTHPLIVPMTMLNHYIQLKQVPYIKDQLYLNPHPEDLALRNQA